MGTIHIGTHEDVMAAAEIANQAAAARASRKGTCYTPAIIAECKKDAATGKWTCTAVSANHRGSCLLSGTPTNALAAGGDKLAVDAFSPNPDEGPDVEDDGATS